MKKPRTFASIGAILRKNRVNKLGEHPICIRLTKNGKVCLIATEHSSKKNAWDKRINMPNNHHPDYQNVVTKLEDTLKAIKKRMDELVKLNPQCSTTEIVDYYKNYKEPVNDITNSSNQNLGMTVKAFYELLIARMEKKKMFSTKSTYVDAFKWLNKFKAMESLPLTEINLTFLEDLLAFITEEKEKEKKTGGKGYFEANTLFCYFKNYKALMNKAVKENFINSNSTNFKQFELSQFIRKKKPRPISIEQMDKIMKLELKPYSRIWNSRNYLLFSFLGNGINFKDMALLKHSNIEDGHNHWIRNKTMVPCTFKVTPIIQSIIDYYKGKTHGDFVFPIILKPYSAYGIYVRINTARGDMNDDLKIIQKRCGIKTNLTFYTGRHSSANLMRSLGFSDEVIGEALGQDSKRSIKHYLPALANTSFDIVSDKISQAVMEQSALNNQTTM